MIRMAHFEPVISAGFFTGGNGFAFITVLELWPPSMLDLSRTQLNQNSSF